jgi:Family of unknown function (DUF6174)
MVLCCWKMASLLIYILLLYGILSQVSAQGVLPPTTKTAEQAKLDAARSTWNTRNPPFYNYQISVVCRGCNSLNYPWRHTVENDIVKGIDSKFNILQDPANMFVHFNRIQDAINSPNELVYALYNDTFGFPTFFQISLADGVSNLSARTITLSSFPTGSARTLHTQNQALWNRRNANTYQYQYTDHLDPSIIWPRTVTVENNGVTGSTDRRGIPTTGPQFPIPLTVPQYYVAMDRQISANAPYLEVYYALDGFPTTVGFVGHDRIPHWHDLVLNFWVNP